MALEVMRIAGSLGAEVHGIDAASLDDATFGALHRAFLEHHAIRDHGDATRRLHRITIEGDAPR